MCNSRLLTSMNTATVVASGATLPLGSAIHGCGRTIRLNGSAINLLDKGSYDINVSVTMAVTGTAAVSVALYENGNAITGATVSATPSEAGATVNLSFPWVVRKVQSCSLTELTLVASGAGTVNGVIVDIKKVG